MESKDIGRNGVAFVLAVGGVIIALKVSAACGLLVCWLAYFVVTHESQE